MTPWQAEKKKSAKKASPSDPVQAPGSPTPSAPAPAPEVPTASAPAISAAPAVTTPEAKPGTSSSEIDALMNELKKQLSFKGPVYSGRAELIASLRRQLRGMGVADNFIP